MDAASGADGEARRLLEVSEGEDQYLLQCLLTDVVVEHPVPSAPYVGSTEVAGVGTTDGHSMVEINATDMTRGNSLASSLVVSVAVPPTVTPSH